MVALTRIRNNQVYNSDINAQYKLQPYSVTGGLLGNNFTYTGNMTVGNLTVNGQTTTLDTTNVVVADPLLAINRNQSGTPTYDLGFVMGRGNQTNVAMIWEETAQQFQLQYTSESTAATTFGTINNSGFANLQAYGIKVNNSTVTTETVTNLISGNVAITGGTLDNVRIGATTPNSGVFTTLTVTNGGTIYGYFNGAIGANTPNTGVFTTVTAGTLGNVGALIIGGTANLSTVLGGTIGNSGAVFTGATLTLTGNASVNAIAAGQIGNTTTILEGTIGTASASQGNITSLGTLTSLTVSGTANLQGTTNGATINATSLLATTIGNTASAINGNVINGSAIYAGNIGNSGAAFTGATSTLTGTSQAASFTTTGGGQFSGYFTGAIGANGANSGTFTTLTTTGTFSAPVINAGVIGNTGASIYGANIAITGNALIQNGLALNSNATLTTNQTTASLFNTTATTVNIGGAATAVNIGASSAGSIVINSTGNSYGAGQGALQIGGGFYAGGDSYIAGNLIVANLVATSQQILVIQEPLLYLEGQNISTYNYDIGFYSHFLGGNTGGYQHTGLVRNYIDNDWYLFSNATEPSGNVVNLASTNLVYDTLKLGAVLIQNTTTSSSTTSGALQVAGGASIVGNLYIGGNVNISGNINSVLSNVQTQSGIFTGNAAGFGALYAGISSGYVFQPDTVAQFSANINEYAQINVQNINGGNDASGDVVVTANNGSNNDTYIDMGINSSGYTQPGFGLQQANDGYLYVYGNTTTGGGNLTISTATLNDIIFSLGGLDSPNEFARMRANTNSFVISSTTAATNLTTGALQVRGGAAISGALYANNFNGVSIYAGTIGNTGSNLVGTINTNAQPYITSVGTLTSLTTSGTITSGSQVIGYLNGVIGANAANSATFTSTTTTGTASAAAINAGTIGNSGAVFTGASDNLTGNSAAQNYNGSGTATINNFIANGGTTSTSTTTGAIIVTGVGGIGVGGNINIGANSNITSTENVPTIYTSNIYPYANSGTITLYPPVNTNVTVNGGQLAANLVVHGNGAAGYQNTFTVNGTTGQVGVRVAPNAMVANVGFQINTTDAAIVPTGSSSQRPSNGALGMVRVNTNNNQFEFYNGTGWTSTGSSFTIISAQQFTGDGSTTAFTLSQSSTTAGTVIAINGVVQIPTTAYSVSGTTLTFTEAPLPTDIIDARVITTTATVTSISDTYVANTFVANAAGSWITVNNSVAYVGNLGGNYLNGTTTIGNSSSGTGSLYVANGSAAVKGYMIVDTANVHIGSSTNNGVNFKINGSTAVVLDTGNNLYPVGNAAANLGSTTNYWNNIYGVTFVGTSTTAKYADLAERYRADANYEPGTVVDFGGDAEITLSNINGSQYVAGVISTNPAYLMNDNDPSMLPVALMGRVPCRVTGPIQKGAMLVSNGDGTARMERNPQMGSVIGKALETIGDGVGVIEVVVGRL